MRIKTPSTPSARYGNSLPARNAATAVTSEEPHTAPILRAPEVCALMRRSLSSLRRDWRAGRFPAPIRIGLRAMGWRRSDIEKHLASLRPEQTAGNKEAA